MYKIIKGYQREDKLRESFNQLAEKTFGLNFENWYQTGYWGKAYIPYSIMKENKVVANVSVNLMDMSYKGEVRSIIQLGTVMTV